MATSIATPSASAPPPSAPAAAPSMSAPPSAPAGGMDFDAAFDKAIEMNGDDAPSSGDVVELPVEAAEEPAVSIGDELPETEAAAEEPALAAQPDQTPQVSETVDPYDEIKPDKVSSDGKTYFTTKAKWERLQAADKTMQALRDIDPGITPDAVKGLYEQKLKVDAMFTGFDSGDPVAVANVVNEFLLDHQGKPNSAPNSVAHFGNSVMANILQNYPQVFERAIKPNLILTLAREAFARYERTHNENDRMLAWNLDHMVHGPTGDYSRYQPKNPQAAAAPEPLAQVRQEQARLQQQQQAFNNQRMQETAARVRHFVDSATTAADASISKIIDDALAIIPAEVREKRAVEYKHAVRDLREEFEKVSTKTDLYQQQYNNLVNQMRTNPSEQTRNAFLQFVEQRAKYGVGKLKKEILQRFSDAVTSQTVAQHRKHAELQQRREPGGGNAPTQRGVTLAAKVAQNPNLTGDQLVDLALDLG